MNLNRGIVAVIAFFWLAALPAQVSANPLREQVFDAVWSEIWENYYDSDFGGKDWEAIGVRYRMRLQEVGDGPGFDVLLREMLAELGESHFSIASPAYNGLMPNSWQGGKAGLAISIERGQALVVRVEHGGPADDAGLQLGDRIVSVDGDLVEDLERAARASGVFAGVVPYYWGQSIQNRWFGAPGKEVEIVANAGGLGRLKRAKVGLRAYDGLMSEPLGNFGEMPLEIETRILDGGVAYLRFNLWFPGLMEPIRKFVRSLGGDVRGLIVDIRGNPGGIGMMATGLAGMLVEEEYLMGAMRMRRGYLNYNVYPQKGAFLGPVAVLIDGSSISTSEIFADSMQVTGRARIVGATSAGAALPSVFKKLPNRYYLQMATADYETNQGGRIEGVGVIPDEAVRLSPGRLRKGEDSVVAAASKWVLRQN